MEKIIAEDLINFFFSFCKTKIYRDSKTPLIQYIFGDDDDFINF